MKAGGTPLKWGFTSVAGNTPLINGKGLFIWGQNEITNNGSHNTPTCYRFVFLRPSLRLRSRAISTLGLRAGRRNKVFQENTAPPNNEIRLGKRRARERPK